jgi:hypothetical protein
MKPEWGKYTLVAPCRVRDYSPMSEERRRRQQKRENPRPPTSSEEIAAVIAAVITFFGVLPVIPFWLRFICVTLFAASVIDLCLRSERVKDHFPSPISRLILSIVVLFVIVRVVWNPMRTQYAQEHPLPSFVYLTGGPFGDDRAPVWAMQFRQFGPAPAYNCHGEFYNEQQDGPESEFHAHARNSISLSQFNFPEADPFGPGLPFVEWTPWNPNHQRYRVKIFCKDGMFDEYLTIARIDGDFRMQLKILRAYEWLKNNPNLGPGVYSCEDSFAVEHPHFPPTFLTEPLPFDYRYWQLGHRMNVGVMIAKVEPPKDQPPPPPPPSLYMQRQSSLFVIDEGHENNACWLFFNGSSQHIGDTELPLTFSEFQFVILIYGILVLGLPFYSVVAFWIMGERFL